MEKPHLENSIVTSAKFRKSYCFRTIGMQPGVTGISL
jgi:hypothetical protein